MDESHVASVRYFSCKLNAKILAGHNRSALSNVKLHGRILNQPPIGGATKGKRGKPKVAFLTGDGSTRRGRSSQQLHCERQMAQKYLATRAYTQILPPHLLSLSTNPRLHCKNRHGARDGLQRLVTLFLRAENFQTYKWSVPSPLIRHLKTGL